ncbi:MAG TPA: tripartite tricarboxylate transporter substrate binding protein [Burkholderiales bacterium]|jgi:tripartite-type tricarboxylate transporter receptor subunit TctC|nr:tripartite tricarboxylate transporter substrate binding protein [Burkholderiales bacterium]
MTNRSTIRAAAFGLLCLLAASAQAQDTAGYPNKPIRIIVPFPAGGTADILPRVLGERLSVKFGQPVLVDNRAGAAGSIGAEAVFKAEPDGYTLMATPPSPLAINPSLYTKLPYDAAAFVPVTVMAAVPNVLLVHPKVPVNTMAEFIAYAKAHPDALNYASQGSGTTSHLTAEMFKSMAGIKMTHVPYKGTSPALTDLLAGQVEVMFDNLGVSAQHVRSGKLKALAVGSEKRVASLPNVPTVAEAGLPGFVAVTWFGVVAPPKTPPEIAAKLSAAFAEALKTPEVQHRLADLSADAVGDTPAQMAAFVKEDTARWRQVIKAGNVKVE